MMFEHNQERSARRISPAQPAVDPTTPLSVAAQRFLDAAANRDGNRKRTIDGKACSIWYLIEFLAADPAVGDLPEDVLRQWVQWLRTTPAARASLGACPSGSRPRRCRRSWPGRRRGRRPSSAAASRPSAAMSARSAGFSRSWAATWRCRTERCGVASRDHAPRLALPPALVPDGQRIAAWWRETLDPDAGPARPSLRRLVVLVQAWGPVDRLPDRRGIVRAAGPRRGPLPVGPSGRREDGAAADLLPHGASPGDRGGDLRVDARRPAVALRRPRPTRSRVGLESERERLAQARGLLPATGNGAGGTGAAQADRQTPPGLRRAASTWLARRDPDVERAQLGHGISGDVVLQYYQERPGPDGGGYGR